jgi:hypothetical protein
MNRAFVILVSTVATLSLTAAAWRSDPPLSAHEAHMRSEAARLRAHFDQMDVELRTRDVSHLSSSQRANRANLIAWLRDYRGAGEFPLNDKFAGEAVPFFRDSKGTLCAMAYLIDRSGRSDIVNHVASTRNNAYIRELVDDRNLVRWLDTWGLTAAEAARIQPAYDGNPCCVIPGPGETRKTVDGDYALLSIGLGGTSIGTLGFNLFSPSRASGAAGVLAGTAAIIAGMAHADDLGDRRVARANVVAGSLAMIGGLRGLLRKSDTRAQTPATPSKQTLASRTHVAPDVILSPNETRVGLRMQARF